MASEVVSLRGILAAVVVATAASACSLGATHADGEGQLSWLGDPESSITISANRSEGLDGATFGGVHLCVDGEGPATLESVRPITTVGGPIESSVAVRALAPRDPGIASVSGFLPADLPGALGPVEGAVIDAVCDESGNAPLDAPRQEVLIALRPTTAEGGGWVGVAVSYEWKGDLYTVELDLRIGVCADGIQAGCPEMLEG